MLMAIYFLIFFAPLIALTTWIAQKKHQKRSEQSVKTHPSEQLHRR